MEKPQQVLRLHPSQELTFIGNNGTYGRAAFSEVVTSKLRLENPSERIVYFKVKTTAPKHYCVRPNSGVIKPGSSAEINVLLQPVDDPAILEREGGKHKFMIQSAFSATEDTPVEEFWKSISSHDVMDSKLRVVFNSGVNATSTTYKQPPSPTPTQSQAKEYKSVAAEVEKPTEKNIPSTDNGTDLRRRFDAEKKALEEENRKLQNQLNLVRQQQQSAAMASGEGGVAVLHVALFALFMFLIGVILGKMF